MLHHVTALLKSTRAPETTNTMALATALNRLAVTSGRAATPAVSALSTGAGFTLPDLPYGPGELEPYVSGAIMELHHGKHHATYVNNLNAALDKYASAEKAGDVAEMIALQGYVECAIPQLAHHAVA